MQYGKSQKAIDRLTAEQRRVTQEAGTERPFTGECSGAAVPVAKPRCLRVETRSSAAKLRRLFRNRRKSRSRPCGSAPRPVQAKRGLPGLLRRDLLSPRAHERGGRASRA